MVLVFLAVFIVIVTMLHVMGKVRIRAVGQSSNAKSNQVRTFQQASQAAHCPFLVNWLAWTQLSLSGGGSKPIACGSEPF